MADGREPDGCVELVLLGLIALGGLLTWGTCAVLWLAGQQPPAELLVLASSLSGGLVAYLLGRRRR